MTTLSTSPKYFEILRALHKGGLSLWLNRRILLPMTLVPIVVTFLTLMIVRSMQPAEGEPEISPFLMALTQIPADFVTGSFCALIILIIMNAPKKSDDAKPVMFQLNIMDRKDLILAGAVAHVLAGYFASGVIAVMSILHDPIQQAAQNGEEATVNLGHVFILMLMTGAIFYAARFFMLPVLLVAERDAKEFYKRFRSLGLSLPIFLVKIATAICVGFVFLLPMSILVEGASDPDHITMMHYAIIDLATAFGTVIAAAWGYAALSVGLRQMMETAQ